MAKFLILLHESPTAFAHVSPAEMQGIVADYSAWAGKLAQQGRLLGGEKLTDDGGRTLRRQDNQTLVTDGPFAEAKDIIGGFFMVSATDYQDACALVADCPHVAFGWIEVRQVDEFGPPA